MKNNFVNDLFKKVYTFGTQHSAAIYTGIAITGMGSAIGMAIDSTIKAEKIIEKKKTENKTETIEFKDVVKTTWKCYIPTALTFTLSTACLLNANKISNKKNTMLITAYNLTQTVLKDYKEAVEETVNKEDKQTIDEKVVDKQMQRNPVNEKEVIMTPKAYQLCYDTLGGRYFMSDVNEIETAIARLNHQMIGDDYISVNDFYGEIGLQSTDIGDLLGWNLANDGPIEVKFHSRMATDGRPCIAVQFSTQPRYCYEFFS